MTIIAASLGFLSLLNLAAASWRGAMPESPPPCHSKQEVPDKLPETPIACHATQGCAEHRRLRTIP